MLFIPRRRATAPHACPISKPLKATFSSEYARLLGRRTTPMPSRPLDTRTVERASLGGCLAPDPHTAPIPINGLEWFYPPPTCQFFARIAPLIA